MFAFVILIPSENGKKRHLPIFAKLVCFTMKNIACVFALLSITVSCQATSWMLPTGDNWSLEVEELATKKLAVNLCTARGGFLVRVESDLVKDELIEYLETYKPTKISLGDVWLEAEKHKNGSFVWSASGDIIDQKILPINIAHCNEGDSCCNIKFTTDPFEAHAYRCDEEDTARLVCLHTPRMKVVTNLTQNGIDPLNKASETRKALSLPIKDLSSEMSKFPKLTGFGGVYTFFGFTLVGCILLAGFAVMIRNKL